MAGGDRPDAPSTDESELWARLTPLQYEVTQRKGTEHPFSGEYWNTKTKGTYRCVVCGNELFTSDTKYDSGTGWPSFTEPVSEDVVAVEVDTSHGMIRTEAMCSRCGAHLGHVFPDGPGPAGQRWCMNSASLDLEPGDVAAGGGEQS